MALLRTLVCLMLFTIATGAPYLGYDIWPSYSGFYSSGYGHGFGYGYGHGYGYGYPSYHGHYGLKYYPYYW